MKRILLTTLMVIVAGLSVTRAAIPEPDNLVFGNVTIGGTPVTAANKNIIIEARRTMDGPAIARYQMGAEATHGNLYLLELRLESLPPVSGGLVSQTGQSVVIVVRDHTGIRDSRLFTVGPRGTVTQIDFGASGGDNGLPDDWETTYFPNPGQDPNDDPDHDGRPNIEEFNDNTNPIVPDTRHPADLSPGDNFLTINEATAYGLAWKTGQPWSRQPTDIPIDYVTRAGMLWKGGEFYKQDLNVSATAPLWWVNAVVADLKKQPADAKKNQLASLPETNSVVRTVIREGARIKVLLRVTVAEDVFAWAIEETLPDGAGSVIAESEGAENAGKLRWGPFFDNSPVTLSYTLTPLPGRVRFAGISSFNGQTLEVEGIEELDGAATLAATFQNGQGIEIVLTGAAGAGYIVEASNDLETWTEQSSVTADGQGVIRFTVSPAHAQQFYRAR